MNTQISVAKDFPATPVPSTAQEGKLFLSQLLEPRYKAARVSGSKLYVNLDGVVGYTSSFLEASFGGLAKIAKSDDVIENIVLTCNDEPYLVDEIKYHITKAKTG